MPESFSVFARIKGGLCYGTTSRDVRARDSITTGRENKTKAANRSCQSAGSNETSQNPEDARGF